MNDNNGFAQDARKGPTDDPIDLVRETFVNRFEPFFVQHADGTYQRVDRALNNGHIRAHLQGGITLGLLPGADSLTKFAVVDIDRASPDAVVPVWKQCDAIALPVLTVYSGRKGFHVIVLFRGPTPLVKARAVMRLVSGEHEVWPKQTRIAPGYLGNCIKAPFGLHRVTGRRCEAIDRGFAALDYPWDLLREIRRVNADAILANAFVNLHQRLRENPVEGRSWPNQMKPCLAEEFRRGTEQGRRNEVGFALATELRRLGMDVHRAKETLRTWNQNNRPKLSPRELDRICSSAFHPGQPYEYGCRPDGQLRQFVACVGPSNCSYYAGIRGRDTAMQTPLRAEAPETDSGGQHTLHPPEG